MLLLCVWQLFSVGITTFALTCFVIQFYLNYRDRNKTEEIPPPSLTITSRILFTRNFSNTTISTTNEVTDALLDYFSNIDTVSQLKYTSFYAIDTEEEFEVHPEKQITGQVQKIVLDESTGAIKLLSFYLQSYSLSITELRDWVSDVHNEYTTNKNNELGTRRYFFNQLPEKQQRSDKKLHLSFDMSQFETTKMLDNLYGEHIDKVQSRIQLFQNKAWYQRNGVPHTLGILLYGEPGCGKTSLIKALANDTNRHVFNVRLADNMTKEQLSQLFFDTKVHIRNKETNTFNTITIPLNQRLYVLEDIDCAENTVLSRALLQATEIPVTASVPAFAEGRFGERELDMIKEQVNKEKEERIDLAFLLNILDGVLETPQRLIVMTTNYPSKLDAALLRPGRIDLILEFKKCTIEMLLTMVQNFYEAEVDTSSLLDERLNGVLTPAEVQEVLCNYIDDAQGAVSQIKTLVRKSRAAEVPLPPPNFSTPSVVVEGATPLLPAGATATAEPPKSTFLPGMNSGNSLIYDLQQKVEPLPQVSEFKRVFGESCSNSGEPCESRISRLKPRQDVTILPAADATPVPRRESPWLKYQM